MTKHRDNDRVGEILLCYLRIAIDCDSYRADIHDWTGKTSDFDVDVSYAIQMCFHIPFLTFIFYEPQSKSIKIIGRSNIISTLKN
jgi:hypothetical protein